jgi:hypothetical protein
MVSICSVLGPGIVDVIADALVLALHVEQRRAHGPEEGQSDVPPCLPRHSLSSCMTTNDAQVAKRKASSCRPIA